MLSYAASLHDPGSIWASIVRGQKALNDAEDDRAAFTLETGQIGYSSLPESSTRGTNAPRTSDDAPQVFYPGEEPELLGEQPGLEASTPSIQVSEVPRTFDDGPQLAPGREGLELVVFQTPIYSEQTDQTRLVPTRSSRGPSRLLRRLSLSSPLKTLRRLSGHSVPGVILTHSHGEAQETRMSAWLERIAARARRGLSRSSGSTKTALSQMTTEPTLDRQGSIVSEMPGSDLLEPVEANENAGLVEIGEDPRPEIG